jgi:hypothetical protein
MGLSPGAKRSWGITGGLLAALAALGLARNLEGPLGLAGTVARLWVFPHAGFQSRAPLGKPATVMPWALALVVALVQWGLVAGLLARWTQDRSPRAQVGWTLAGTLGVGLAVLVGAGLAFGEIGMD